MQRVAVRSPHCKRYDSATNEFIPCGEHYPNFPTPWNFFMGPADTSLPGDSRGLDFVCISPPIGGAMNQTDYEGGRAQATPLKQGSVQLPTFGSDARLFAAVIGSSGHANGNNAMDKLMHTLAALTIAIGCPYSVQAEGVPLAARLHGASAVAMDGRFAAAQVPERIANNEGLSESSFHYMFTTGADAATGGAPPSVRPSPYRPVAVRLEEVVAAASKANPYRAADMAPQLAARTIGKVSPADTRLAALLDNPSDRSPRPRGGSANNGEPAQEWTAAVPEPNMAWMLVLGLIVMALRRVSPYTAGRR